MQRLEPQQNTMTLRKQWCWYPNFPTRSSRTPQETPSNSWAGTLFFFMSPPSQDRFKVYSSAQGTSTLHFRLTSSAFFCCLFYELHISGTAKLTCSLLFLCHWLCHFLGLRKCPSLLFCMVKFTCPSRPRSDLTSSWKPTTLSSPAFCL